MKVEMMEEIENHKAFRRKDCCVNCGGSRYTVHHLLPPQKETWWVSCDACGYEGYEAPVREVAIARWRQHRG